jgi:hypothetical protein
MFESILDFIKSRIYAAGLYMFDPPDRYLLDGLNGRIVTYGMVNPDQDGQKIPLRVGIDYFEVPLPSEGQAKDLREKREVSSTLGTLIIEQMLQYVDHEVKLHLVLRETRDAAQRHGKISVNRLYIRNQSKLMGVLGAEREERSLIHDGVSRGFVTKLIGSPSSFEYQAQIHVVLRYLITYPLLDGIGFVEANTAKEVALVTGGVGEPMPDLDTYPVVTLTDKQELLIIE